MRQILFSFIFFLAIANSLYATDLLFGLDEYGGFDFDILPCERDSIERIDAPGSVCFRCKSSGVGDNRDKRVDEIIRDITRDSSYYGPESTGISRTGQIIREAKIKRHIEKLKIEIKEVHKQINSDLRSVNSKSKDLRDNLKVQLSLKAKEHNRRSIEIMKGIPIIDGLLESRKQTYKTDKRTPFGKEIRKTGMYANYAKRNADDEGDEFIDTAIKFLAKADQAATSGNLAIASRYLQEANDFINISLNPSINMLDGNHREKFKTVKSFVLRFAKGQTSYPEKIKDVVAAFDSKESNLTTSDQLNAFMAFTQTALSLAYSKGKKVLKERTVGGLEKGLSNVKGLLDAFDNIIEFGKGSISGLDISAGSIVHDFVESVESGLKAVLNPVKTYQKIADLVEKFDKDAFTKAVGDFFATKYDEFRKANPHDRGEMAGQLMGDIVLWALAPSSAPPLISARIAAQTKFASALNKLSKASKGIPSKALGENLKVVNTFLLDETGSISFLADLHGSGFKTKDTIKQVFNSSQDLINKIGGQKFSNVLKTPKGSRPNPNTYLPKDYIETHLGQFDEGATRFMKKSQFEKLGAAQADGTAFVIPKKEADQLLSNVGNNKRALEEALGYPKGTLDNEKLVRIDISKPKQHNIRIPSGNEPGANDLWIPGGKLPNNNSEAVLDLGDVPSYIFSITDI